MSTVGALYENIDHDKRERELNEQESQQRADQEPQGTEANETAQKEYHRSGKRVLLAAEKGRLLELVRHLTSDPSLVAYADSDGYTPLHRASYGGHKDCAKYLVRHGADVNAKTTDDWTPLHCAVRWNNIDVAGYLLEHGADINAKSSGGNTPLHIVASNGRYSITCDIIQMLLYHPDCDYASRNSSGDTAFDIAKRSGPFYKFWSGVMTLVPDAAEPIDD